MYKNITGLNRNENQTTEDIKGFKLMFNNAMDSLKKSLQTKKTKKLKKAEKIKKLEKINATKAKFSQIVKKDPFLTTVHKFGFINNPNSTVEKNDPFREARRTQQLIFPSRILEKYDKEKLWKYNQSSMNFFRIDKRQDKLIGNEEKQFLESSIKTMEELKQKEREEMKSKQNGKEKREKQEEKFQSMSNWNHNDHDICEFKHEYNLRETDTPRAIRKKTLIARALEKKVWSPNNYSIKEFGLFKRKH